MNWYKLVLNWILGTIYLSIFWFAPLKRFDFNTYDYWMSVMVLHLMTTPILLIAGLIWLHQKSVMHDNKKALKQHHRG